MVAVRPASGLQRYAFCMINSKSAIYFVESAPGGIHYYILCPAARRMPYAAKEGENRSGKMAFLGSEN